MGWQNVKWSARDVWALAQCQHWVVTRVQLAELGLHPRAVDHRIAVGRLHPVHAGVYAVGRRELSRPGELMAAVLACGEGAALSHGSAAELLGIGRRASLEVTVPLGRNPRRPGIKVHRRALEPRQVTRRQNISVTGIACTLVDLSLCLPQDHLERAINDADRLDLIDPEELRGALEAFAGRKGVAKLRTLLDRRTFTLTDSQLERRFKPIARAAGLPPPLTQQWVNGYRVDFFWPDLGLVVETDGLRYHRTPAQQNRALIRDQAHLAAGLQPLRFSHSQVAYDGPHVEAMLRSAALRPARAG